MFVGMLAALVIKAQSPLALTINDFDIKAGETKTVYVAMQNEGYDVIAIEFKMQLPKGLSLADEPTLIDERIGSYTNKFGKTVASGKTANYDINGAGYWTFSIFSMTDQTPFVGTEGNVIAMSIAADANIAIGETAIRLYDIELSTKDAPYYPGEYSNEVTVCKENVTTSIDAALKYGDEHSVYDLQGRKLNAQSSTLNSQLKKGVYIVDGKKSVVNNSK